MADTRLEKAYTGSNGNMKKWTISVWLKRSGLNSTQYIFAAGENNSADGKLAFNSSNQLYLQNDGHNGSNNAVQRDLTDTNAWYHIVWRADTDESANNDRWKLYINGELISASEYGSPSISSGGAGQIGKWSSQDHWIGDNPRTQQSGNSHYYFDGYMSHFHYCDGYAYDASAFGETDATTGEWKIKTDVSVSYGTNGFFVLKDGNSVTDQSPNTNNLTVGNGTLVDAKDNPSNVFTTLNPLYVKPQSNPSELTNGNTGVIGGSAHRADVPTMAVNSGKWYMEAKAISGSTTKWWWGLGEAELLETKQKLGNTANFIYGDDTNTQGVYDNNLKVDGSTAISSIFGAACAANDIVMIAVDLDNQKVWYGLNGVWNNGSASQSTTFNSSYPDSTAIVAGDYYYIGVGNENTKWHTNYGNGYFGTTAVSSAGTNASNNGIFEYDVPANFTALSTKGLNL